jgi:arginyl-tRNA--protein-N-Asp/Glu arginylyltransferase
MRSAAYTIYQKLLLVMHTKENPSDAEWADYCAFTAKNLPHFTSTIIVTEGGAPNTMQRGQLNDLLEANNFKQKVAVVTISRLARGIVTALSWYNPNIKAFSPTQIPAALDHVEFPRAHHEGVMKEIRALRQKLQLPLD